MKKLYLIFVSALIILAWTVDWPRFFFPGLETYIRWGSLVVPLAGLLIFGRKLARPVPAQIHIGFFGVLFCIFLSAVFNGIDMGQVIHITRLILCYLSIYTYLRVATNIDDLFLIFKTIQLSCLFICVSSLLLFWTDPAAAVNGRLTGISWEPNFIGYISMLLVGLTTVADNSLYSRIFSTLCVAVALWASILTEGSLAIATIGLYLASIALFYGLRASFYPRAQAHLLRWRLLYLACAATLLFPLISVFSDRLAISNALYDDRSSLARYFAWSTSWDRFLSNPFVGAGYGVQTEIDSETALLYSHSVIMDFLGTTGSLGLVAFVLMMIHCVGMAQKAPLVAVASNQKVAYVLNSSCGVIYATLMYSSVEAGLQLMPQSWLLLWCSVGSLAFILQPVVVKKVRLRFTPSVTVHPASSLPNAAIRQRPGGLSEVEGRGV